MIPVNMLSRLKIDLISGCMIWTGAKNSKGYGYLTVDKKRIKVHRFMWEANNGKIPKHDSPHGMCILHKCDNPSCVNPDHLFIGTHQDNMADRENKRRGKNNGNSKCNKKLTRSDVLEIRYMIENGWDSVSIGNIYNVSRQSIASIREGRTWAWL